MDIIVTFPGGKRVEAQAGPFTIATDQPPAQGGTGSAPEPFTLFLASIGTCAGFYVVAFCQARNIATDGIRIVQRTEADAQTKQLLRIMLDVEVPPDFPARYREAVAHAAAACKVKKTILAPPKFEIHTSVRVATRPAAA